MTVEQRTPAQVVDAEIMNRIDVFLEGRERWNPVRSLTKLTSQVAHEYEDRFLVELLQNAYDAHAPGSTGGHVWIILEASDASSEHGVLYVANTGRPFAHRNFEALSNIALSSKPPGEGIGNKGLGFRSVLQICEWPEVYSCHPGGARDPSFSGYCFGFATDSDLEKLPLNAQELELVKADFSRHLLPVGRVPQDPVLTRLRNLGAVTVVRLPMKSQGSFRVAKEQMEKLRTSNTPVMLFLDRINSLTLEWPEGELEPSVHVERRKQKPVTLRGIQRPGPTEVFRVATAGRKYLMGRRSVPESAMRDVVQASVKAQQLDASWLNWEGAGEVAVAVPVNMGEGPDGGVGSGEFSTYTFLPMDVESPLGGHLSAPFYTKLARIDLNKEVELNSYLFDVAADLACEVALTLLAEPAALGRPSAGAVVDLLTWADPHEGRVSEAFAKRGLDFRDHPWVPAADSTIGFVALQTARLWASTFAQLTASALVAVGVDVVDLNLGQRRQERINALARQVLRGRDTNPSDEEVADWVERVAKTMHDERASLEAWREFYNDLLAYFGHANRARALQGKRILLVQGGRLRRAGPWDENRLTRDPTIFLPPRRVAEDADDLADDVAVDDEEFRIPKRLQRAVAFLHEGVAEPEGAEASRRLMRSPAVEMLEAAKLVERFDRHAMFRHLRRMLSGRVSDEARGQALRWVYLQHVSSRQGLRGLGQLRLTVPTRSGWIAADQAFFSGSWPGVPPQLERLLAQEADRSTSLTWVSEHLLLGPDEWPFLVKDVASFSEFLAHVGVRSGLWPMPLSREPIEQDGHQYTPVNVAELFGLDDPMRSQWVDHVKSRWRGYAELAHPYTPYRSDPTLWILPGQDCYAEMDGSARGWLAALITMNAGNWAESAWTFQFRRERPNHRRTPDPHAWPSPLASFVECAKWFPMTEFGQRDLPTFSFVGEAWLFIEEDGERAPRFIRMPPHELRRALESTPSRRRLRQCGLQIWNETGSAERRLRELALLLASGSVTASERSSFRHACEAAWADLTSGGFIQDIESLPLVVSRGGEFSSVEPSTAQKPSRVLLPSEATSIAAEVVESIDQDLLVCHVDQASAIDTLLSIRPDLQLRRLADLDVRLFADGDEILASSDYPLVVSVAGDWLGKVVALAVALQASPFRRMTDRAVTDAVAALRRIRVVFGRTLNLRVDGESIAQASSQTHLRLDDPMSPILLVRSEEPVMSWDAMEAMSDGIAVLVGEAGSADGLRAGILALAKARGERWEEPQLEELASAFRVSTNRVSDVLAGLRGAVDQMVYTLMPALAALTSTEFALSVEAATWPDTDALARMLSTNLATNQVAAILDVVESGRDSGDLRLALSIPLGAFNRALRDLGRQPIHFGGQHEAVFAHYLNEHRDWLSAQLRHHSLRAFHAVGDLATYAELRHLPSLTPDPEWLEEYEAPPEALMRKRCAAWLLANGIEPHEEVKGNGGLVPILDEVRHVNQSFLDGALPRLAALAIAWHHKDGTADPSDLSSPTATRERLIDSGCLDFEFLTDTSLLPWLVRLSLWPDRMPQSISALDCGVGYDDFTADPTLAGSAPASKEARRKLLVFGGRNYSVEMENLRVLAEAARASVDDRLLGTGRRLVRLNDLPPRRGSRSSSGGGGRGRPYRSDTQMSEGQKRAVGLVGEVLAFEWLKRNYTEVNDDSWISGYRSMTVGGYEGDDERGYDFEVTQISQILKYEVKATSGDDFSFELGASELRAARAARLGSYRIIFIQNVLDSEDRRLMVLPNPLEPDSGSRFRQTNSGIRFSFEPKRQ